MEAQRVVGGFGEHAIENQRVGGSSRWGKSTETWHGDTDRLLVLLPSPVGLVVALAAVETIADDGADTMVLLDGVCGLSVSHTQDRGGSLPTLKPALLRGGGWFDGAGAGPLAVAGDPVPSDSSDAIGFRCAR